MLLFRVPKKDDLLTNIFLRKMLHQIMYNSLDILLTHYLQPLPHILYIGGFDFDFLLLKCCL